MRTCTAFEEDEGEELHDNAAQPEEQMESEQEAIDSEGEALYPSLCTVRSAHHQSAGVTQLTHTHTHTHTQRFKRKLATRVPLLGIQVTSQVLQCTRRHLGNFRLGTWPNGIQYPGAYNASLCLAHAEVAVMDTLCTPFPTPPQLHLSPCCLVVQSTMTAGCLLQFRRLWSHLVSMHRVLLQCYLPFCGWSRQHLTHSRKHSRKEGSMFICGLICC
jgi:hypothetical protein